MNETFLIIKTAAMYGALPFLAAFLISLIYKVVGACRQAESFRR